MALCPCYGGHAQMPSAAQSGARTASACVHSRATSMAWDMHALSISSLTALQPCQGHGVVRTVTPALSTGDSSAHPSTAGRGQAGSGSQRRPLSPSGASGAGDAVLAIPPPQATGQWPPGLSGEACSQVQMLMGEGRAPDLAFPSPLQGPCLQWTMTPAPQGGRGAAPAVL